MQILKLIFSWGKISCEDTVTVTNVAYIMQRYTAQESQEADRSCLTDETVTCHDCEGWLSLNTGSFSLHRLNMLTSPSDK